MITKRNIFIYTIIILQPVIDLLTSLTTVFISSAVTPGIVFRVLLLVILTIFIYQYFYFHHRSILQLYFLTIMTVFISLLVNYFLKDHFILFEEINFAVKTIFFLTIVFTAIIFINGNVIHEELIYKASNYVCLIIGFSYWLSIFTKTGIDSYLYEGVGYSGWFYSANELSVTILILLGITITNIQRNNKNLLNWVAFSFMLSMISMIGTKTAFFGGMILVFVYLFYMLYKVRLLIWKEPYVIAYCMMVIVFIFTLPSSPINSNTQDRDYFSSNKKTTEIINTKDSGNEVGIIRKLLSSRDIYFDKVRADYSEASVIRKLIGLGFSGDYKKEPKLIEMDLFDLFFSYGILGTIILLAPLILLILRIIVIPKNIVSTILMLTFILCFGISFLAGHVLFAPSVMTYLGLLFVLLGLETRDKATIS